MGPAPAAPSPLLVSAGKGSVGTVGVVQLTAAAFAAVLLAGACAAGLKQAGGGITGAVAWAAARHQQHQYSTSSSTTSSSSSLLAVAAAAQHPLAAKLRAEAHAGGTGWAPLAVALACVLVCLLVARDVTPLAGGALHAVLGAGLLAAHPRLLDAALRINRRAKGGGGDGDGGGKCGAHAAVGDDDADGSGSDRPGSFPPAHSAAAAAASSSATDAAPRRVVAIKAVVASYAAAPGEELIPAWPALDRDQGPAPQAEAADGPAAEPRAVWQPLPQLPQPTPASSHLAPDVTQRRRLPTASSSSSKAGLVASLKQPSGLSRSTIIEDAPFPPPGTTVTIMELQERCVRAGPRLLRYRGFRPNDYLTPSTPPPAPPGEGGDYMGAGAQAGGCCPEGGQAGGAAGAPQLQAYHAGQPTKLHIKVPWAEPHQLAAADGGGLLGSLNAALSSGRGYFVVGAAVRHGCILVTLDLLPLAAPGARHAAANQQRQQDDGVPGLVPELQLQRLKAPPAAAGWGQAGTAATAPQGGPASSASSFDGRGGLKGFSTAQLGRVVESLGLCVEDGMHVLVQSGDERLRLTWGQSSGEWEAGPVDPDALAASSAPDPAADGGAHNSGPPTMRAAAGCACVPPPGCPLEISLEATSLPGDVATSLLLHDADHCQAPVGLGANCNGCRGCPVVARCLGRVLPAVLRCTAAAAAGAGGGLALGVAVFGLPELLSTCRQDISTLHLELWHRSVMVVATPVLLLAQQHEQGPGSLLPAGAAGMAEEGEPAPAAACTTATAPGVEGLASELEAMAAAAAATGDPEDALSLEHMMTDFGTFMQYMTVQRQQRQQQKRGLLAVGGAAAAAAAGFPSGLASAGGAAEEPPSPSAAPRLRGSLDLSSELLEQFASDWPQQCDTMLLMGHALMGHALAQGAPALAARLWHAFRALGYRFGELDAAVAANNELHMGMLHLAIASGHVPTVQAVMAWAAEADRDGDDPGWTWVECHGLTPLQLAAAAGPGVLQELMRAATHAQHDAGGEWDQGARQEEEPDMALAVAAPSLPLLPAAAAAAAGPAPLLGSRPGDASLQLQHQQQQQLTAGASTSARLTPTAQAAGPTPAAARPPPAPAPLLRTAWSASLLGFLPPSLESSYQRYAAGQASMLAWVWAPLMSAILLAAVARCVRSGDLSELPVSVLFAWPYPLVSAGLLLAPRATQEHIGSWWVLCTLARLSNKLACIAGLVRAPPSMLLFTRRGVTLLTDAVLPGLCERMPWRVSRVLRALDLGVTLLFYVHIGISDTLMGSVAPAVLKLLCCLGGGLLWDLYFRHLFVASWAGKIK